MTTQYACKSLSLAAKYHNYARQRLTSLSQSAKDLRSSRRSIMESKLESSSVSDSLLSSARIQLKTINF